MKARHIIMAFLAAVLLTPLAAEAKPPSSAKTTASTASSTRPAQARAARNYQPGKSILKKQSNFANKRQARRISMSGGDLATLRGRPVRFNQAVQTVSAGGQRGLQRLAPVRLPADWRHAGTWSSTSSSDSRSSQNR